MDTEQIAELLRKQQEKICDLLARVNHLCWLAQLGGCDKELAQYVADGLGTQIRRAFYVADNAIIELLIREGEGGCLAVAEDIMAQFCKTPEHYKYLEKRLSNAYAGNDELLDALLLINEERHKCEEGAGKNVNHTWPT